MIKDPGSVQFGEDGRLQQFTFTAEKIIHQGLSLSLEVAQTCYMVRKEVNHLLLRLSHQKTICLIFDY